MENQTHEQEIPSQRSFADSHFSDLVKERDELKARLQTETAQHEYYRNKVAEFMGANQNLKTKLEASEKACAEMRKVLLKVLDCACDEDQGFDNLDAEEVRMATFGDAGQNYVPRSELEQAQKAWQTALNLEPDRCNPANVAELLRLRQAGLEAAHKRTQFLESHLASNGAVMDIACHTRDKAQEELDLFKSALAAAVQTEQLTRMREQAAQRRAKEFQDLLEDWLANEHSSVVGIVRRTKQALNPTDGK